MLDHIRSGNYLTRDRIAAATSMLLAGYALALAAIFVTSPDGLRDFRGIPMGSDFFAFWSGGKLAIAEGAASVYDPLRNYAIQKSILNTDDFLYLPFLHPPQFLLLAIALATLPYVLSWTLFSGATMAASVAVARRLAPVRGAVALIAAAPAAFITATHGQAGFLMVALFGGALAILEKRPLLAGALFGLLAFKPQYGLLIPVALIAAGRWRTFAAAAATLAAALAVASAAFGPGIWPAFLAKAEFARTVVLEGGAAKWATNFTLFSALRSIGVGAAPAYAVHFALALGAAASIAALWRSDADHRLKSAGLLVTSVLATPYAIEYDMILLVPAVLLLWSIGAESGFRPFEKSALALAWAAPLFASQIATVSLVPVGFLSIAALYASIEARRRALTAPPDGARGLLKSQSARRLPRSAGSPVIDKFPGGAA